VKRRREEWVRSTYRNLRNKVAVIAVPSTMCRDNAPTVVCEGMQVVLEARGADRLDFAGDSSRRVVERTERLGIAAHVGRT
jgi:hypothetical protein